MKYLKLFENHNDFYRLKNDEIKSLCRKYYIEDYTINEDGSIDVDEDVCFYNKSFDECKLKFRNINGNFDCSDGELRSLKGGPIYVSGNFKCDNCSITSLEGCPEIIGGEFDCSSNLLKTLEGGPKSVGDGYDCSCNELTDLNGSPREINGYFLCTMNRLSTLEGCPENINGTFEIIGMSRLNSFYGCNGRIGELSCTGSLIDYVWVLFEDCSKIELFNYFDIIRDGSGIDDYGRAYGGIIILDRLNEFLEMIGKPTVDGVKGYKCI